MRNLIYRGDTWHFRGYVPKDLISVVGKGEIHRTLKTSSYSEAIHRRDTERIIHRNWIDESRRRYRKEFLVLDELTDAQILDMAREVYAREYKNALDRKDEFAQRARDTRNFGTGGYEAMYEELRKSIITGSDPQNIADEFVDEILEERLIDISQSPASRERLRVRILEVMAQVQIDLLDMISGKPGDRIDPSLQDPETRLPRPPSFEADGRANTSGPTKNALSDLAEEFLAEMKLRRREKGYRAVEATMRLMKEFFGPKTLVSKLRRRDCNQFRDFVMSLPANYRKRYPNKSLREIPQLRKPEHDLMSYANVNKTIGHLIQFLRWCEEMEIIERAPNTNNLKLRDPVSDKEKRLPFTTEQLHLIFASSFISEEAKNRSMFFWCYVIGLYHGLRLNEIASLRSDSILPVDGIPCIDIRISGEVLGAEVHGWTKTMERTLPMHPVLVKLGLPEFARARPKNSMLFSEARVGADGYLSRDVSDGTRKFFDSIEIPNGGPTFHSFRHNFRDAMSEADLPQEVAARLGGWRLPGVMNEVYGSGRMRRGLLEHLSKITYGEIDEIVLRLGHQ